MYTFVTVTKIRYVTVDARLYTQGENKTQKSCTVLIEGKDTHDCSKKVKEKNKEGIVSPLKKLEYMIFKLYCILPQPTKYTVKVVLP